MSACDAQREGSSEHYAPEAVVGTTPTKTKAVWKGQQDYYTTLVERAFAKQCRKVGQLVLVRSVLSAISLFV
jgi:hypothetical protein